MRAQRIASDEHGRPWLVTVDVESGDASGPLMPCCSEPQWQNVSVIPPQQYVTYVDGTIRTDVERWKQDLRRVIEPRLRPDDYGSLTQEKLTDLRTQLAALE